MFPSERRQHAGWSNAFPVSASVWLVLLTCAVPEVLFWGAELDLWASPRLRALAIAYGGFWAGLLDDWVANYPAQPALMFLTYGFLHAGPWHFIANMMMLLALGNPVARAVGEARFLIIYGLCLLAGGLGFLAFPDPVAPMVGASGGLFGLAGTLLGWDFAVRRAGGESVLPVVLLIAALVVLNLVYWWTTDGLLAWQTHLGGFAAGWILSGNFPMRPARNP